jgi:hypothetical protein
MLVAQVAEHGPDPAQVVEQREEQAEDGLHLLVGVEVDFPRGPQDIAGREACEQGPSLRLVQLPAFEPVAHGKQLRLTHGPF